MGKKFLAFLLSITCLFAMCFCVALSGCFSAEDDDTKQEQEQEQGKTDDEEEVVLEPKDYADGAITKFTYDFDIADNSSAIFIGSSCISKLEIGGVKQNENSYAVRNDNLLLKSFNALGVGSHTLKVTYKTKTAEFTLNLADNKPLKYDDSALNGVVVPFGNPILPKMNFLADNQAKTVTYSVSKNQQSFAVIEQDGGVAFMPSECGVYTYNVKIQRKGQQVYDESFDVNVCKDSVYNAFVKNGNGYNGNAFELLFDSVKVKFDGNGLADYSQILNVLGDANGYTLDFDTALSLQVDKNSENKPFVSGLKLDGAFIKKCVDAGLNAVNVDYEFLGWNAGYTSETTLDLYVYDSVSETYSPLKPNRLHDAWENTFYVHTYFFSIAGLTDIKDNDYILFDIPRNKNKIQFNGITFTSGVKDVSLQVYIDGVAQSSTVVDTYKQKLLEEIGFITPVNNSVDISSLETVISPEGYGFGDNSIITSQINDSAVSYKLYFEPSDTLNVMNHYSDYFTFEGRCYDTQTQTEYFNESSFSTADNSLTMHKQYGWGDTGTGIVFNKEKLQSLFDRGYTVIYVEFVADYVYDSVGYVNLVPMTSVNSAWTKFDVQGFAKITTKDNTSSGKFVITQELIDNGIKLVQDVPSKIIIKSITASKPCGVNVSVFINGEAQNVADYADLVTALENYINVQDIHDGVTIDITSVAQANAPVGYELNTAEGVLSCELTDKAFTYSLYFVSADGINLLAGGIDGYFTANNGGSANNLINVNNDGTVTFIKRQGWTSIGEYDCGLIFNSEKLQNLYNMGYVNITVVYSVVSPELVKTNPLAAGFSSALRARTKVDDSWVDVAKATGFESVGYDAGAVVDSSIEYTGEFKITADMVQNGLKLNQNNPGTEVVIKSIIATKTEDTTADKYGDKIIPDVDWELVG